MPQTNASTRHQVQARQRAEMLSAAAIILVCLGIGGVTLSMSDNLRVPHWTWALMLGVCIAAVLFSNYLDRRLAVPLFLVAVAASWGLLMSVENQGFVEVILIVVAATGSFVIPLWGLALVIVGNTVTITVHASLSGADVRDSIIIACFYLFIHVAAVTSTYIMLHESRLRAELEERTVQLTAASVMLEDSARNSERLRISRELHDLIGHQLTVLNLELEAARHRNDTGDKDTAGKHINQAGAVAKALLSDVRSTVSEMRDSEPGDITEALKRMASAVPSLEVHISVHDDVRPDDSQATVLIRGAQEIITNAVKHSDASKLSIEITRSDGMLRLHGKNDGAITNTFTPGNGLRGLEERVTLLDGTMSVEPRDGFNVEIALPEQLPPVSDAALPVATGVAGQEGRSDDD